MSTTTRATITPAAPCLRCGREDGLVPQDHRRPWRGLGYCHTCYSVLTQMVARWGFRDRHQANAAVPYTGDRGQPSAQRHAHAAAQGRRWSRESFLRDEADRRLPGTIPTLPAAPGDTTPALLARHRKAWRDAEALDRGRDWHTLRPTTPDGWRLAATDARRAA